MMERLREISSKLKRRKLFGEAEIGHGGGVKLQRTLGVVDVTAIGLGQIIGAGIFVLTGVAAKNYAGPAIILSYVFSGIACVFSALCYAEFASRSPTTGSAYGYAYSVAGELMAWIIGWDLTLEYAVAAAAVARGWSGYLVAFFAGLNVTVPKVIYSIDVGFTELDFASAALILAMTTILCMGVKDSTRFNLALVILTVIVIFLVVGVGSFFIDKTNWNPFLPHGVTGVFAGASVIFFAYVGFDTATTVAEEMKNPKRDLPIAIIGSLVISICLYVAVAATLTLMVPYHKIVEESPVASAFALYGMPWMEIIVSIGASAALITTCFNSILAQSRICFAMARDGLLFEPFSKLNEKTQTPVFSTIVTGFFAVCCAFFFTIDTLADMVSIGTLLAFTIVCGSIMKLHYDQPGQGLPIHKKSAAYILSLCFIWLLTSISITRQWPLGLSIFFGIITLANIAVFAFMKKTSNSQISAELNINFVTPWVPFVPIAGMMSNIYLMANLSNFTWVRLAFWLFLGLCIYFLYGIKHSKMNGQSTTPKVSRPQFIHLEEVDIPLDDDDS